MWAAAAAVAEGGGTRGGGGCGAPTGFVRTNCLYVRSNICSVRNMKKSDRLAAVLDALKAEGRVEVAQLAPRFGVSEMTVRRDLEDLERRDLCRRVHGGAIPGTSRSYEPPFGLREQRDAAAKDAIGAAVVELLGVGETVFLDVGTTTLAVARALQGRNNLTVLTPSLPVANLLADEAGLRVICLGGVARPGERSLVGSLTLQAVRQFYVDVLVLGIGGLDAEAGLTEFNLDDAAVKRAALERSRRLIVAADETKLGAVAFAAVAPADRVDVLVTNAARDHAQVRPLRDLGVDVRLV